MAVVTKVLTVSTQGNNHVVDISELVRGVVAEAGFDDATCTVFVPHTTVGVTGLEFEPGANRDLGEVLDRIAPPGATYHHNVMDSNGHAHARAAILGPSVSLPVVDGEPVLGTWQSLAIVDFDDRPRTRTLYVQVTS